TIVRNRAPVVGAREPILDKYERVTFEKDLINAPGKPVAEFVCPGQPLLDATIDVVIERHRELLKRGAILVDETDADIAPRVLVYLEHAIQDARTDRGGNRHIVSRQMQFAEMGPDGKTGMAGYAPYLDYRPISDEERVLLSDLLDQS